MFYVLKTGSAIPHSPGLLGSALLLSSHEAVKPLLEHRAVLVGYSQCKKCAGGRTDGTGIEVGSACKYLVLGFY